MSARSSKGIVISITKPTDLVGSYTAIEKAKITSISNANPAVITFDASATGYKEGDIVSFAGTGKPELDGKSFVLGTVDSTTHTAVLLGANLSKLSNPIATTDLGAAAAAHVFAATDEITLCLSSLGISVDTPGTVSVATYCDPTASLPASVSQAGTLSMGGYIDITDPGYALLLDAEIDGKTRILKIKLPDNGFIVVPVTVSNVAFSLPIDGAVGFTANAVMGSKPRHVFSNTPAAKP